MARTLESPRDRSPWAHAFSRSFFSRSFFSRSLFSRSLFSRSLGTAGLILSALACTAAALPEADAPVVPQGHLLEPVPEFLSAARPERLRADVELLGLELGTLTSSVCPTAGGGGIAIESQIESSPLVSLVRRTSGEARTELVPELQAPRASEYQFKDGDLLRHYRVSYQPGAYEYSYDNGGNAQNGGREVVPEGAYPHDMQTALVLLRSWRPRLGETAHFYVVLGRRLWRVEVTSAGPEMIRAQGYPQLAHRLDGVAVRLWQPEEVAPRHLSVWLSEDAARVPLRLVADSTLGAITLSLKDREKSTAGCTQAVAARAPTGSAAGIAGLLE